MKKEVERCRDDENNAHCRSVLECANEGGYVRGTRDPFPEHGPCCKYAALFDERPVFDSLRWAFLVQADPRSGVGLMLEALGDLIGVNDTSADVFARAIDFHTMLKELHAHEVQSSEPHEFAMRAWEAYVESTQETNYYFLSTNF